MRHCNQGWFREQAGFIRQQFLQEGSLPFTNVLSDEAIANALDTIGFTWRDRVYTPLVTLWVFLSQVISSDHSCRSAVARLIAHRVASGQTACSARTGAYCQARARLPEKFFARVVQLVGQALESEIKANGLGRGDTYVCSMDRLSPCLTRQPIRLSIRKPGSRKPELAFRLPGSAYSHRFPAERFSA